MTALWTHESDAPVPLVHGRVITTASYGNVSAYHVDDWRQASHFRVHLKWKFRLFPVPVRVPPRLTLGDVWAARARREAHR